MKRILRISLLPVILVVLAACSSDPSKPSGSAVRVLLTDTPLDLSGVDAVNVTISGIVLYPTGSGDSEDSGVSLEEGPISVPGGLTLNLLDFQNGKVTLLGSEPVPPGSYDRIRLHVTSAELLRDDDSDPMTPDLAEEIFVPSGKVDVPVPFALAAGETMEITLDFDAKASVQVNTTQGEQPFILRPVVTPVGMKTL